MAVGGERVALRRGCRSRTTPGRFHSGQGCGTQGRVDADKCVPGANDAFLKRIALPNGTTTTSSTSSGADVRGLQRGEQCLGVLEREEVSLTWQPFDDETGNSSCPLVGGVGADEGVFVALP